MSLKVLVEVIPKAFGMTFFPIAIGTCNANIQIIEELINHSKYFLLFFFLISFSRFIANSRDGKDSEYFNNQSEAFDV